MKKKPCKLFLLTILVTLAGCFAAFLLAAGGCTLPKFESPFAAFAEPEPVTVSGFMLNTYVSITAYDGKADESLLADALNLCTKYENCFSRTLENSELSRLNRGEITVVSDKLGQLIRYGLEYGALSGGALDISIGKASSLWDFTSDTPVVPDHADIQEALKFIDYSAISLSDNPDGTVTVHLPKGMLLDLGAIAKGFIADEIKTFLVQNGITSAIISLGGNILCVGTKPDGTPFHVGVRNPSAGRDSAIANIQADGLSVVSSGNYERCFTLDGKFYHHILSPKTGYPCENNLTQVTIISEESITGDCLSTACYVLGLEKGMALIDTLDGVEAVFLTDDGKLHYSKGAAALCN